jgi:hypothetical protein
MAPVLSVRLLVTMAMINPVSMSETMLLTTHRHAWRLLEGCVDGVDDGVVGGVVGGVEKLISAA